MKRASPQVLGSKKSGVQKPCGGWCKELLKLGEDASSSVAAGKVSTVHPFEFLQLQVNSVGL
jgi:hypothetical protein